MELSLDRYASESHSRRVILTRGLGALALGLASRGPLALASTDRVSSEPACALTSEQTTGPYYIDRKVMRYDLTEGKPGVPLRLRIALVDVKRCAPLKDAALDIWHCDAMGVYSGFTANSPDGPPGGGPLFDPSQRSGRPPGPPPGGPPDGFGPPPGGPAFGGGPPSGPRSRRIDETNFLRGVQLSDKQGIVEFATIYPGWYVGRDIHIHLRVHIGGQADGVKYRGGYVSHTGQLFFSDDLTDHIAHIEP
jgi:protocatechuate 3,4-dioxygenase beta subunit